MPQPKSQKSPAPQLDSPRVESSAPLHIAGLRQHFTAENMNHISDLWNRFIPHLGSITSRVGHNAYGLCWTDASGGSVEYLAGVELSDSSGLPHEFSVLTIPALKYAVFQHKGHVSSIYQTCEAISKWLPRSSYQTVPADTDVPNFFERYSEQFNPETGTGGMEIWVPIQ